MHIHLIIWHLAWRILAVLCSLAWFPLNRWRYRKIPGPFGLPLLGNLRQIAEKDLPIFVHELQSKYGQLCKYWFASKPFVVVADPEIARKICIKSSNRPGFAQFTSVLMGHEYDMVQNGIVWARGHTWRLARKAFDNVLLRPDSLAGHLALMDDCAASFAERLLPIATSGQVIDIHAEMGKMTLAVVGSCAYGVDFHTLDDDASPKADAAKELFESCKLNFASYHLGTTKYQRLKLLLPWFAPLIRRLAYTFPDMAMRRMIDARRNLFRISRLLMTDMESSQAKSPPSGEVAPNRLTRSSFLARIIDDSRKEGPDRMSDVVAVAQCISFILAGYDTTANTLAYCSYLLAVHPAAEARMVQEISEKVPTITTPLTTDIIQQCVYTEAVVKEAMRLFPVVPWLMRELSESVECMGCTLPAGTWIHVPTWSFQRDPLYWPRPDEFLPERFLPGEESLAATNPDVYLPFGIGSRMCVGYKFAMQEAIVALVRLYQRYTFQLQPPSQHPVKVRTGLTMTPIEGVKVTVARRQA